MRPAQFDDVRRQLKISLLGQELTPTQVRELADIIGQQSNPIMAVGYFDESGPMPTDYLTIIGARDIQIKENAAMWARLSQIATIPIVVDEHLPPGTVRMLGADGKGVEIRNVTP